MTPQEFNKIIVAIKGYYQKENIFTDDHTIELWYQSLKDISYNTLYVAVQKWVETERWSPTIADLRRLSFEVSNPEIMTWDQAWETVMQAVRHYGYNRRIEALDSFDEITRKTVNRVGWMQICSSEEIGIERAAFRDIYKALTDKTKTEGQMAQSIKKVIEATRNAHVGKIPTSVGKLPDKGTNKTISDTSDSNISLDTQDKIDMLKEKLKKRSEQQ